MTNKRKQSARINGTQNGKWKSAQLSSLQPEEKEYWECEPASKGFCVRVSISGKKTYMFRYNNLGKRRYINLGDYTTVSLKDARMEAQGYILQLDKGIDPYLEIQRTKQAEKEESIRQKDAQNAVTVEEVLNHYLTTIAPSSAKNAETKFRNSHCNVYRLIGGMKLKDVTEDDLWGLLDRHTNRGKQSEAARLRSYMKAAFNKAKKHRPFKLSRWSNPFLNIEKPEESENVHDRALSSEEIRDFWTLLDESDEALLGVRAVLKLLLILGQRVEETSKMKWSSLDLDAGVWDIPPADNKTGKRTGKGHVVPLPLLVSMITINSRHMFTIGDKPQKPKWLKSG